MKLKRTNWVGELLKKKGRQMKEVKKSKNALKIIIFIRNEFKKKITKKWNTKIQMSPKTLKQAIHKWRCCK